MLMYPYLFLSDVSCARKRGNTYGTRVESGNRFVVDCFFHLAVGRIWQSVSIGSITCMVPESISVVVTRGNAGLALGDSGASADHRSVDGYGNFMRGTKRLRGGAA